MISRKSGMVPLLLCHCISMLLVSCGSGDTASDSVSTFNSGEEPGPVLRVDEKFTIENFIDAGFKLNSEFETDTVPLAENVYYGFASQRDIEIRKYATHADALSAGVESALAAIGRSPSSNAGGGIITSTGNRTSYHAYLVAGNTVLLCQIDISACENLVNRTLSASS